MNSAFSEWQEQLSHSICCWKKRPELHNSEGVRADECRGGRWDGNRRDITGYPNNTLCRTLALCCQGLLCILPEGYYLTLSIRYPLLLKKKKETSKTSSCLLHKQPQSLLGYFHVEMPLNLETRELLHKVRLMDVTFSDPPTL